MRSNSQGLLASLLMFIPLLAVPFLASSGVPWLAAKAKSEGVPVPEMGSPSLLSSGVGQSNSGKHSVRDLFAPVVDPPAVDLRLNPGNPAASVQNPHLRNASLIVSRAEPWGDPFEQFNSASPETSKQSQQAPVVTQPQNPLEDWLLKEEPEKFGPADAPAPQEFSLGPAEVPTPRPSENPFAAMEASATSTATSSNSPVPVEEHAFEDPRPQPKINRDPNRFDASRTLFAQSHSAPAPERNLEREPAANPMPKAGANVANTINEPPKLLTWESARDRLHGLGIKDYYLQPDPAGQLFLFRCSYSPPDNPRVNRVFEAEAAEPLEAVRKVLAQLEN